MIGGVGGGSVIGCCSEQLKMNSECEKRHVWLESCVNCESYALKLLVLLQGPCLGQLYLGWVEAVGCKFHFQVLKVILHCI